MLGPTVSAEITSTRESEDTIVTAGSFRTRNSSTGDWSAVIVNYNGDPFLGACLAAIERVRLKPRAVFVVDNASSDDSMLELHGYPRAEELKLRRNLGFSGGANAGLRRVETTVAVVMNPDVELDPDFGDAVVSAFVENERLGVAGSLLLYPDGVTIQHAGGVFTGPDMSTGHLGRGEKISPAFERETPIDFATGAAVGLRMEAVRQIGGFDTRFAPVYYEDVDLASRMRQRGWEVKLIPSMRGLHHEGVTLGQSGKYYVYLHRNRILYALEHLSSEEWNGRFLPAEFSRLRAYLGSLDAQSPEEVVGAESIDLLLRQIDLLDGTAPANSMPLSPTGLTVPIEDLNRTRSVQGKRIVSRIPLAGAIRNFFNNLGPRWYVDQALADQRAFNDAVVRAFEAQRDRDVAEERLNRERVAMTLLLGLILLGRMRTTGDQPEPWVERESER